MTAAPPSRAAELESSSDEPAAEVLAETPLSIAGIQEQAESQEEVAIAGRVADAEDPVLRAAAPELSPAAPPVAATPPPAEPIEPSLVERDISSGSLLCNRYVLGRVLGSGGGAYIFQAEDRRRIGAEDFGTRIAIKVLRPEVRRNSHALTRLKREFRQMQRLLHPGIARVFELGCDEDVWFMTMELIDGQTVNQWLKTNPSRSSALQVISACCDALAHAHEAGVVHGDLKPSNVLVLADNTVKLVDFGSAAERDMVTGEVDKERSFAATPPYASPQILAGDVADPRDDVFSLACLAYAILTRGEHPFDRKSSAEAQRVGMRPAYARMLHPREFDVIVRALAWERAQRPATVHDFLHALLASDWRRETREGHGAGEMSSKGVSASAPIPESVTPQAAASTLTPAAAELDTPAAAKPETSATAKPDDLPAATQQPVHDTIRAEDVVRLKAVLAAAEAHAERIERRDTPPAEKHKSAESKSERDDALARFRGYVAGPLASQGDVTLKRVDAAEPHASDALRAAAQSKKSKRTWPWQRGALLAALLAIGAGAVVIKQRSFEADPIQRAEAHPTTVVKTPPAIEISTATPPVPATVEPSTPEKKSAPDVTKPKAPAPAWGKVSFATRTLQVGAGQTIAALTVKRTQSQRGRASVSWTIEAGTARAGVNYIADSPAIRFLDGQEVRSLFIKLIPDADPQSSRHSKTFTVKLQPSSRGPQLGEIDKVYVTIVGDVGTGDVAENGTEASRVSASL